MNTLQDAISMRLSRRKYIPEPLPPAAAAELQALMAEYNSRENLNIQLALDNGEAFNGFRKSYGMFSGVRNYFGLIADKSDLISAEKLGYYGELLVLHAVALGFGTCWVGGSFHRASCPFAVPPGQSILCTIVVGRVEQDLSRKERLIRYTTHRKTKTIEQMYTADEAVPAWFLSGMAAVQAAPSAMNRQPVSFTYQNGAVSAAVQNIAGEAFALDLGIAKLHFELGAGGGKWDFGNGAKFRKDEEEK